MTDASAAQRFYGRWASLYDVLARTTPGVASIRATAAASLDLERGDVVVDLGCGTGANVPHLRERVGDEGHVIGVDFTPEMLARARANAAERGWENVTFVRGDASTPPVEAPVDAVVASFLVGMLDAPADAVARWTRSLAPGGRIALVDAARSSRSAAWPANQFVKGLVLASAPRKARRWAEPPWARLDRRVEAAHRALRERADDWTREEYLFGVVRVTTGRVPAETAADQSSADAGDSSPSSGVS